MIKITKIIFIFIILNFVKGALLANDNFTLPHKFNSGNTISSTEMNENMNFLKPYFVKSNGIPIGVFYMNHIYDDEYLFFNGTYKSTINLDGNLFTNNSFIYIDSSCTDRLFDIRGAVFRLPDKNSSTYSNGRYFYVYPSNAFYTPVDSQPVFDENDIGVAKWYTYSHSDQVCREQTVSEWNLKFVRPLQNDPNITGINHSYPTPITIEK